MIASPSTAAAPPALGSAVSKAIAHLYPGSGAARYGLSAAQFTDFVSAVIVRYLADAPEPEQLDLLSRLRVEELVLARACSAGNDAAWDAFLLRYRPALYETARRIAKDDSTARELADELYADLYGVPNSAGHRASKLDSYTGRGSLEGWLRAVLSQQFIDRCRSSAKTLSLDEQLDGGSSFAAPNLATSPPPDPRLAAAISQSLEALTAEERFLLASWYLDQRTLADLARQLRVHESTMSRRLDRIVNAVRKRVRKSLITSGLSARQCDELIEEIDVRDLDIDVAAKLRQETPPAAFYKKDGSAT
jgi:RNA polymerase sigma-70 factor, ECF subfamily